MQIIAAPNAFKGSLTAPAAAAAIARGCRRYDPECLVDELPLADGGDGTAACLVNATGGELLPLTVTGPLGEPVTAQLGLLADGETAVVEMATASGIALVPPERLNPWLTTSRGTGELIAAALARGYRRVIVGLGGSATTDGGTGILRALGVRFLDAAGHDVSADGDGLLAIDCIDISGLLPALRETELIIASDVTNPLCGPQGAAAVFGPQKGATPEQVVALDAGLRTLARAAAAAGYEIADFPGAGAAGGTGAALAGLLGGRLVPGAELLIQRAELTERLAHCDLVITGEGRVDATTAHGKAPAAVIRAAAAAGVPVVVLGGSLGDGFERLYDLGRVAVQPLPTGPMTLAEAMAATAPLIEAASERALRMIGLR